MQHFTVLMDQPSYLGLLSSLAGLTKSLLTNFHHLPEHWLNQGRQTHPMPRAGSGPQKSSGCSSSG